jgi:hypothetical protein
VSLFLFLSLLFHACVRVHLSSTWIDWLVAVQRVGSCYLVELSSLWLLLDLFII